jgi:hypothetical protein
VAMMRFRYIRHCTVSEVWAYWRNKVDGDEQYMRRWSRCKGRHIHSRSETVCDVNESWLVNLSCDEQFIPFYESLVDRQTSLHAIHFG